MKRYRFVEKTYIDGTKHWGTEERFMIFYWITVATSVCSNKEKAHELYQRLVSGEPSQTTKVLNWC
jgi:hypothetical protein